MFAKKKSNNIEILSEEEINNLLQESDMISTGEKDDDLLAEIFGVATEKPPFPSPDGISIKETNFDRIMQAASLEAYQKQERLEKAYRYFSDGSARKKFGSLLREWRKRVKEYEDPGNGFYCLEDWILFVYEGKVYRLDILNLKTSSEKLYSASDDIIADLKKIDGVTAAEFFITYD